MNLAITVNHQPHTWDVAPGETLLEALRSHDHKGPKLVCGTGDCSGCGVLLDGQSVNSCCIPALQAHGREVMTVEGLAASDGALHPLQQAFADAGAAQCGFCTPGMLMRSYAFLQELDGRVPSEDEVIQALSGNYCRCTGYVQIVEAVRGAAATPDPRPQTPDPSHGAVGASVHRSDARTLVTGAAAYTTDYTMPGMLHARILHSPHAHARIVRIDTAAATALPGVRAVVTHEDVPGIPHATAGQSWPETSPYDSRILDSTVRYVGDWVAFVAADTPQIAGHACSLIDVEYDILPAVFDPTEATLPGAPQIHQPDNHPAPTMGAILDAQHNLVGHSEMGFGDMEAAMAAADVVLERDYSLPFMQHCALEPHASVAWLDGEDRLNVVSSTQVPFHTRRQLALALGLPIRRVRIVKPRVGGGFGGKQEMLTEPVAAVLALKTRRPVRIELTRSEEFTAARVRHAMRIRIRSGVKRDGTLTALDMRVLNNTGAYGGHGKSVAENGGKKTLCLYHTQASRFSADTVYTNLPIGGAFRGYGGTQGYFALESHMDEIADAIGMDPLELRLKNVIQQGDHDAFNHRDIVACGLPECVEKATASFDWAGRKPVREGKIRRGYGLAISMQGSGVAGAELGGATIKLNEDGSFNLLTGAADVGQGADTVMRQIAAETLGVNSDDIVVGATDTDLTTFDCGCYASSTTYISGGGVLLAAQDARRQILDVASRLLEIDPDELDIKDSTIYTPDGPTRVTLKDVALDSLYGTRKHQIVGSGDFSSDHSPPPYYLQLAEIEVDTETGRIKVLRLCNAVDLGKAINPAMASGQVEGAVAMGIGYGLTEELKHDAEGRVRNGSFVDYKIVTTRDMPQMTTILVENPEPSGPYGAKSVGEVPINGPAPAIANALFDACGIRIRSLPLTPEKVLAALDALASDTPSPYQGEGQGRGSS